jgi:hypothetical protein
MVPAIFSARSPIGGANQATSTCGGAGNYGAAVQEIRATLLTCGIASQPDPQLLCIQRRSEEIALAIVTAHTGEHFQRPLIFDALGTTSNLN